MECRGEMCNDNCFPGTGRHHNRLPEIACLNILDDFFNCGLLKLPYRTRRSSIVSSHGPTTTWTGVRRLPGNCS
jgi:hypothetical protein